MAENYKSVSLTREEVNSFQGRLLLNFGTDWCGICKDAVTFIDEALKGCPEVRHIKVEDAPGLELGRSFKVKLWPTLILIKDGVEVGRVVRPNGIEIIVNLLSY